MIWMCIAGGAVAVAFGGMAFACCIVAGDADERARQHEMWENQGVVDEPRCDITGQPLTLRERFEQECG